VRYVATAVCYTFVTHVAKDLYMAIQIRVQTCSITKYQERREVLMDLAVKLIVYCPVTFCI
jgi:hypothetical protein